MEPKTYYILVIEDRISGVGVTLYATFADAFKKMMEYVQERMSGELYPFAGDNYTGISSEDSGTACVHEVEIQ